MRFALFIAVFLVYTFQAIAAPLPGVDWDWQLSGSIAPPTGILAFGADPDSVTRAQITALNDAGVYTICYVSVGTMETYRDDVELFPDEVIGKRYEDWPNEYFLDIRDEYSLPHIMGLRFFDCKLKGFQAVEPDNLDVYTNDSGFDLSRADILRYIRILVRGAHDNNLEIGQKNVPELTPDLVGMMDFVITESCYQDRWCDAVSAYVTAGKPVFDAEYSDRPINWSRACAEARNLGISMILKNRDLTAGRKTC